MLLGARDDEDANFWNLHDLERTVACVAARGHRLAKTVLAQRLAYGDKLGALREQARWEIVVVGHGARSTESAADHVGRELVRHEDAVLGARRDGAGIPLTGNGWAGAEDRVLESLGMDDAVGDVEQLEE